MMKYLFDTHAFIWYATGDSRLTRKALDLIESYHHRFISIASIWEMAIKVNIGNLKFKKPFDELISEQLEINDYELLDFELEHFFTLSRLELFHRDPFDRIIICQAMVEDIPVVSADENFDSYDIERIW